MKAFIFVIPSVLWLQQCFSQIPSDVFEYYGREKIGKYVGFNETNNTRFYYRLELFSDQTFNFLSYTNEIDYLNGDTLSNLDSLRLIGKYHISNGKIFFDQDVLSKKGVNWYLTENFLKIKGRNTNRLIIHSANSNRK